jgi:predicted transcriptional regulator
VARDKDKVRQRLYNFLASNPNKEFEAREIERAIQAGKTTVNGYLRDFENDSMVIRRESGYYVYWRMPRIEVIKKIILSKQWTLEVLSIVSQDE